MATTDDLIARTRDLLGEETADLYTDDEILAGLNEGIWLAFTRWPLLRREISIAIEDGTSEYELEGIAAIEWLGLSDGVSVRVLKRLLPEEAAAYIAGAPAFPAGYMLGISDTGETTVRLYPDVPSGASGTIVGLGYGVPPDLTTGEGGQSPAWHKPYHFMPCYWAAAALLRKDRRPEAAADMEARFYATATEYMRWLSRMQPYTPQPLKSSWHDGHGHWYGGTITEA